MGRHRSALAVVMALAAAAWGCRLPGTDGPVPKSLATCRQLSQQGVTALERGQRQKAEELLAKAVRACPADAQARRHYAESLWLRGAGQEAVAQLEKAVEVADDAAVQVRLAEMRLAMGQGQLARQHAERAISLNPKLAGAWAARGLVFRAEGRPSQALADFHRALGHAPDDRKILFEVAELHRELNQPERALQTLQTLADTYTPGDEPQQVLHLTGMAQMALGRADEAIESLSAAAAREKPTPEILYRLGEAHWLAGHPSEAEAAARQALGLQPSHPPSQDLLSRIESRSRMR